MEGDSFWNTPGGTIEFNETAKDCLSREMKEELKWEVIESQFIGVLENFFTYDNKKYKEIVFYFKINRFIGKDFNETTIIENGREYIFQYFPLDEIDRISIKPNIFKEILIQTKYPFSLVNYDK